MDYIILSIPVFFILIGVELLIAKLRKTQLYRFNDAVTNISCGIASQITSALAKTVLIAGYLYLYDHVRLFEIPGTWWMYLLLFIGVDFCYYWFHRLSHEVNVFWGAHIVHHQSEEFNLSVALRQSSFQGFISMIFYLPLAILGFNPIAFVTVNAFQTLYQFWIHTKLIGRLHPVIEFIFNTPSHHRVHHGRNPKYIDKNHGGTLIIFDRMFGTFQKEEEEVIYGVTKPLASWNPVWANVDYYADLLQTSKALRVLDRMKMLWHAPGWLPESHGGFQHPKEIDASYQVYRTTVPMEINAYVLGQFVITLAVTTYFLFNADQFTISGRLLISGWVILSILNLGGIFELKKWAVFAEITRHFALVVLVFTLRIEPLAWTGIITSALALPGVIWFLRLRKYFWNKINAPAQESHLPESFPVQSHIQQAEPDC